MENVSYGNKLHVIHNPNQNGSFCNFQQHGLSLASIINYPNLPTYPHYRTASYLCAPLSIQENSELAYLSLFPNPCVNKLTLQGGDYYALKNCTLYILDAYGKQYKIPYEVKPKGLDIDVNILTSGIYSLMLEAQGNTYNYRIAVIK